MPNPKLLAKARYLRKTGTDTEKILWKELRNDNLGVKFRRQHPLGRFILDFYAPKIKLAIELDGKQHKEMYDYDKLRAEYLKSKKITLLRFWNFEVENDLEKVINKIKQTLSI